MGQEGTQKGPEEAEPKRLWAGPWIWLNLIRPSDSWGLSVWGPLEVGGSDPFRVERAVPAEKVQSRVRVVSVPHRCGRLPLLPPGWKDSEALLPKFL